MVEKLSYFFSSRSRMVGFVVLFLIAVSVPVSLTLLSHQQDLRQHAAGNDTLQIANEEGDPTGGITFGGGGDTGGGLLGGSGIGGTIGGTTGGGSTTCPAGTTQCGSSCYQVSGCSGTVSCNASGQPVCSGTSTGSQTGAGGTQQNTSGTITNCTVDNSYISMTSAEQQEVTLINQYRQQQGLSVLPVSLALTRDAAWMTKDMGDNNNYSHTDTLGRQWDTRASQCGYPDFAVDILDAGSSNDPAVILASWEGSADHNEVILDHVSGSTSTYDWKAIGVASYQAPNGTIYWDAVFGLTNDGGVVPTTTQPTPTRTPTPTTAQTITATPSVTSGTTATPTTFSQATATPTIPANSTTISAAITLPGLGNNLATGENSTPSPSSKNGQIQLVNLSTGQIVSTSPVVFNWQSNSANFGTNLSGLTAGTYDAKIRIDNSLWKDAGNVTLTTGQTQTIPSIELTTGDINGDNTLDLIDYNAILSCYGQGVCAQQNTDLNLDGKVDEKDLNIFYSGLAKRNGD